MITPGTGTTVSGSAGTGNGGTPANTPQSQPVGSSAQGDGSGTNFGSSGFVDPDQCGPTPTATACRDAWENAYGGNLDPRDADDDADGLSNVARVPACARRRCAATPPASRTARSTATATA